MKVCKITRTPADVRTLRVVVVVDFEINYFFVHLMF
jgi:hypothetical protein